MYIHIYIQLVKSCMIYRRYTYSFVHPIVIPFFTCAHLHILDSNHRKQTKTKNDDEQTSGQ